MSRFPIVPADLQRLVDHLKSVLPKTLHGLGAENLVDAMGAQCIELLRERAANWGEDCELIVWGRSAGGFEAAWTSAPPEDEIVGAATAPNEEGLMGMVSASRQSMVQTLPDLDPVWTNLGALRGRELESMAASPVIVFDQPIAVVSLARYNDKPGASLKRDDVSVIAATTALIGRLVEDGIIRDVLGL